MSDNIKVVVKVRPLIPRETEEKLSCQWKVRNNTLYQLDQYGKESGQSFTFEKVYDIHTNTSDVYNDIAKPIVEAATQGINGTIFAYGQTSSGKTYTMSGTTESPGIIPMAVLNLFKIIKNIPDRDFLVRVSYIEIYNETLKDLLDVKKNIKIHETYQGCVKVDATEKVTSSPQEVIDAMSEGQANRQVGSTNMNEESSRSHSIFQITIESREHIEGEEEAGCVNVSQLNLVDLAGSERAGQTGATGVRFKEGTHINKSLSTLALVIKQLSDDPNKFANYRDSKLTRILQNSLGGNAKTSIICAITPAAVEETVSTLQFATRAKKIRNKPEVNAVATNATMIQSLTKQLGKLQSQLESKKNLEHDNKRLNQEIERLKGLILNAFGRPSLDVSAASRRKTWCAPRRQTISTLPKLDESDDFIPDVPKFCTPSLKYNPLIPVPGMDFRPISEFKMPSVPEEPSGRVTPQFKSRTVDYNNEIIEIDSDDDDKGSDAVNCSPYHKCYGASKTPPCVLRRNAKRAEKSLKDLVELTDIEKIYSPQVAELIEKIDDKTSVIAKLQEEINELSETYKEKESEVNLLKGKVSETEVAVEKVSTEKLELEKQCRDYVTKLTDLEFSFETLKQKYQRREQELLSRLEEDKPKDSGISLTRLNEKELEIFMDLNEISLVHSDNESSVIQEEPNNRIQNMVTDMQSQLTNKNRMILNLEESLQEKAKIIYSLEHQNQELQQKILQTEENLKLFESENSLLRSSIESLNSTIKSQRENLETASSDLILCNDFIKELQLKCYDVENKENQCGNFIDTMKIHEEKIIANNDNIKNIMHTIKAIVEKKDKEILSLKCTLSSKSTVEEDYRQQIKNKDNEVNYLCTEVENLKQQMNLNVKTIDNLIQEKKNFLHLEENLTSKLNEIQTNYLELQNLNEELKNKIIEYEALLQKHSLSESNIKVTTDKLKTLETDIELKNEFITSLEESKTKHLQSISNLESEVTALKQRISELKGNEAINSLTEQNNSLSDKLNSAHEELEYKIKEFMSLETKLNDANEKNENLRSDIVTKENTILFLREEISSLRSEINILTMQSSEVDILKEEIDILRISFEKSKEEYSVLLNRKNCEVIQLTADLKSLELTLANKEKDVTHEFGEKLEKEIQDRDFILKNLYEKVNNIFSEFYIVADKDEILTSKCHETIIILLDKIFERLKEYKSIIDNSEELDRLASEAHKEIKYLKDDNEKLISKLTQQETEKKKILEDLQKINSENMRLNTVLINSNKLIKQLQTDFSDKKNELEVMQNTTLKLKNNYLSVEILMREQLQNLQLDYEKLKKQYNQLMDSIPESGTLLDKAKLSPPSLLTICCDKILDYIQNTNKNNDSETSSSESEVSIQEMHSLNKTQCFCSQLSNELEYLKLENESLAKQLNEVKDKNQSLMREHEEIREEIKEFLGPALDLEKKIINHRTNLCTLSATTYAENRLLRTQVKTLQHHLSRLQKICENDLPYFSKQLNNLLLILKTEYSNNNQLNASFKRFSLPVALDRNASLRNESTIDGDLLMLETNVTLSTTVNNTWVAQDQTTLDVTNLYLENEDMTDQNFDYNNVNTSVVQSQIEVLSKDYEKVNEQLQTLKEENINLRSKLEKYCVDEVKKTETVETEGSDDKSNTRARNFVQFVDAQISPMKLCIEKLNLECSPMKAIKHYRVEQSETAVSALTLELSEVIKQKQELEHKYESLSLEIPSTESLVRKINNIEKDLHTKSKELEKLHGLLKDKTKVIEDLQQENDTLSTQVFENISESDDLQKEIETLKQDNSKFKEECSELNNKINFFENNPPICLKCSSKSVVNSSEHIDSELQVKVTRSFSDSDRSLRDNKIFNLQKELNAGKEDCRQISENVADILNHFNHNDMSYKYMEGDVSKGNSSNVDLQNNSEENRQLAAQYSLEKSDCLNYFLEKTKTKSNTVNCELKFIEIIKMLHDVLFIQHKNEIENLNNKLRDSEDAKETLQNYITELNDTNTNLKKKIEETVNESLFIELKNTTNLIYNELSGTFDPDCIIKLSNVFKNEVLSTLDQKYNLCTCKLFQVLVENIVEKNKSDLSVITRNHTEMSNQLENVTLELKTVNESLVVMKTQLDTKEQEFNLLKAQKERIHEISSAVTLDIVQKEQVLRDIIAKGKKQLLDENIIWPFNTDPAQSLSDIITSLFENLINERKHRNEINQEKENLLLEVKKSKTKIEEKEKHINNLKDEYVKLQDNNEDLVQLQGQLQLHKYDLAEKEKHLDSLKKEYEQLQDNNKDLVQLKDQLQLLKYEYEQVCTGYENAKLQNDTKDGVINDLTNEFEETKREMEAALQRLEFSNRTNSELETKMSELLEKSKILQEENGYLKHLNQLLTQEKETCTLELEKASAKIQQQKMEYDKMTADMLVLKESVAENKSFVENLQQEAQSLYQQNLQIKEQLEEKIRECSRLEMNIKTHEKTVEIQSGMIIRLKQKEEDKSKDKELADMSEKYEKLKAEFDAMKGEIEATREQLTSLTSLKNTLETRLAELEAELSYYKARRKSVDGSSLSVRQRRHSILDSKRMFGDAEDDDHKTAETIFSSRSKPNDLFMEVDDNSSSNRSTPVRLSRGRESFSRLDNSENSEDHSRPSSVAATRRRRQSIHDLHRSTLRNTPSPHDQPIGKVREETRTSKSSPSKTSSDSSELSRLKEQLKLCQQELEVLKEKFREVDEECEICSEYLKERDEQCFNLGKEKLQLQKKVVELEEKLKAANMKSQNMADASVNTDEDWSNLHSVVVDRMSYDVEVEKNKKLSKALEEYRFKNRDLKATLIKVQKALENEPRKENSAYVRELEHELKSVKRELKEVQERCKELDDECETCGEYLREREEQCTRLKEAKLVLEAQLRELQDELRSIPMSLRKKRHTAHDKHRDSSMQHHDATTETSDDFLSYQVERDNSSRKGDETSPNEAQLRATIDRLTAQKAVLEQQLNTNGNGNAASNVMFVATGSAIVQNQQMTDVMRENQKLKKINAKLLNLCKQRKKSHSEANRENENPADKCI